MSWMSSPYGNMSKATTSGMMSPTNRKRKTFDTSYFDVLFNAIGATTEADKDKILRCIQTDEREQLMTVGDKVILTNEIYGYKYFLAEIGDVDINKYILYIIIHDNEKVQKLSNSTYDKDFIDFQGRKDTCLINQYELFVFTIESSGHALYMDIEKLIGIFGHSAHKIVIDGVKQLISEGNNSPLHPAMLLLHLQDKILRMLPSLPDLSGWDVYDRATENTKVVMLMHALTDYQYSPVNVELFLKNINLKSPDVELLNSMYLDNGGICSLFKAGNELLYVLQKRINQEYDFPQLTDDIKDIFPPGIRELEMVQNYENGGITQYVPYIITLSPSVTFQSSANGSKEKHKQFKNITNLSMLDGIYLDMSDNVYLLPTFVYSDLSSSDYLMEERPERMTIERFKGPSIDISVEKTKEVRTTLSSEEPEEPEELDLVSFVQDLGDENYQVNAADGLSINVQCNIPDVIYPHAKVYGKIASKLLENRLFNVLSWGTGIGKTAGMAMLAVEIIQNWDKKWEVHWISRKLRDVRDNLFNQMQRDIGTINAKILENEKNKRFIQTVPRKTEDYFKGQYGKDKHIVFIIDEADEIIKNLTGGEGRSLGYAKWAEELGKLKDVKNVKFVFASATMNNDLQDQVKTLFSPALGIDPIATDNASLISKLKNYVSYMNDAIGRAVLSNDVVFPKVLEREKLEFTPLASSVINFVDGKKGNYDENDYLEFPSDLKLIYFNQPLSTMVGVIRKFDKKSDTQTVELIRNMVWGGDQTKSKKIIFDKKQDAGGILFTTDDFWEDANKTLNLKKMTSIPTLIREFLRTSEIVATRAEYTVTHNTDKDKKAKSTAPYQSLILYDEKEEDVTFNPTKGKTIKDAPIYINLDFPFNGKMHLFQMVIAKKAWGHDGGFSGLYTQNVIGKHVIHSIFKIDNLFRKLMKEIGLVELKYDTNLSTLTIADEHKEEADFAGRTPDAYAEVVARKRMGTFYVLGSGKNSLGDELKAINGGIGGIRLFEDKKYKKYQFLPLKDDEKVRHDMTPNVVLLAPEHIARISIKGARSIHQIIDMKQSFNKQLSGRVGRMCGNEVLIEALSQPENGLSEDVISEMVKVRHYQYVESNNHMFNMVDPQNQELLPDSLSAKLINDKEVTETQNLIEFEEIMLRSSYEYDFMSMDQKQRVWEGMYPTLLEEKK